MADAAAAEMEQMKVEEEKKEVVTALAGAFGVAPPRWTPGASRAPEPCFAIAPRVFSADPPTTDRPGSRLRLARGARGARAPDLHATRPPARTSRGARGA